MSQSITYGGVDIAGHIKLPEGVTGMTSKADGSFGAGSALIDDGAGDFNFVSLQEFVHEESACSEPRTFDGFLVQRRLSRGNQVAGVGRDHDFDIVDLNYLLHLQPLRGATAKRPVESGDDRMAWLLASVALDGIVFDNGFIGSNPNMFDEADYTLQYADDVLADLSVSSSAEVGRIFFVYRDSSTGEPSLFMDRPTVTSYTSTLSISNDLDDLSDTCFAPYMDAELSSSGEDIYCSVFFKYKTGTVFRHNDTTHATYFASKGYHRQGVFETTRVGSEDTAIRHADAWLANHSGDLDTITCQVQLPADKVNLLMAGMRVNTKFTHFPGYDSFGYLRVSERTVGLEPVNDLYLVRLVLSNRTITPGGTGSGSTGDFPAPPPGAATHYFESTITYLSDGYGSSGGAGAIAPGTNTTSSVIGDVLFTGTVGVTYNYHADMTIDPADLTTGHQWGVAEDDGTGAWGPLHVNVAGPGTTVTFDGSFTITGSDFTGWLTASVNAASHIQKVTSIYAYIDPDGWEAGGEPVPPAAGQWVYGEVVTMSGGAGTTDWPFADGSLRVRYDIVDQTPAIVSYDGATGDFQMPSDPPLGTQVFVDYQGR